MFQIFKKDSEKGLREMERNDLPDRVQNTIVDVLTETRSQGMNKVKISHKGRKYKNVLNVGLKNAMTELKSR